MTKFEITWLEDRSDESVLEEIRRVASLMPGLRLTVRAFNSRAKVKSGTVVQRFGSWSEATRRAGLSDALPIYGKDAVVGDIQRVSALCHDEPFTIALYSKHGRYSSSLIKRQFGGWHEALDGAGLGDRYVGPPVTERMKVQVGRAISDDDIVEQIRKVSALLDKASLSGADVEANSDVTQSLMWRRFGSVSAALKRAGVEQVDHGRRYTEDEIFENLLDVWMHCGRPPTALEMDRSPSTVGKNAYIKRYGGWRKALKAFVERANSDSGANTAHSSNNQPLAQADPNVATRSLAVPFDDRLRQQSVNHTAMRTRVARSAPRKLQPEDRRDPNIGLRFRVLLRDSFKCVLCGDHPARNPECVLHVDHIVPWSKGGKTSDANLRTLCATCNIGRGNRFAD
jgi:5-methylcytosine-specific restriction endonuclease McrA